MMLPSQIPSAQGQGDAPQRLASASLDESRRVEELIADAPEDPQIATFTRCWELHQSCRRSGAKVGCFATGMLASTGRLSVIALSLSNDFLESMKHFSLARAQVKADEEVPATSAFLALSSIADPPGPQGAFFRFGGSSTLPLPKIRGTYGFDQAKTDVLCCTQTTLRVTCQTKVSTTISE